MQPSESRFRAGVGVWLKSFDANANANAADGNDAAPPPWAAAIGKKLLGRFPVVVQDDTDADGTRAGAADDLPTLAQAKRKLVAESNLQ